MATVEILLLGLPAYRRNPLQHLLERAKHRVTAAPDLDSAAGLLSDRFSCTPCVVLTDTSENYGPAMTLLWRLRTGGRCAGLVFLIPAGTAIAVESLQCNHSAENVHLPAAPGDILRAIARVAKYSIAERM